MCKTENELQRTHNEQGLARRGGIAMSRNLGGSKEPSDGQVSVMVQSVESVSTAIEPKHADESPRRTASPKHADVEGSISNATRFLKGQDGGLYKWLKWLKWPRSFHTGSYLDLAN